MPIFFGLGRGATQIRFQLYNFLKYLKYFVYPNCCRISSILQSFFRIFSQTFVSSRNHPAHGRMKQQQNKVIFSVESFFATNRHGFLLSKAERCFLSLGKPKWFGTWTCLHFLSHQWFQDLLTSTPTTAPTTAQRPPPLFTGKFRRLQVCKCCNLQRIATYQPHPGCWVELVGSLFLLFSLSLAPSDVPTEGAQAQTYWRIRFLYHVLVGLWWQQSPYPNRWNQGWRKMCLDRVLNKTRRQSTWQQKREANTYRTTVTLHEMSRSVANEALKDFPHIISISSLSPSQTHFWTHEYGCDSATKQSTDITKKSGAFPKSLLESVESSSITGV